MKLAFALMLWCSLLVHGQLSNPAFLADTTSTTWYDQAWKYRNQLSISASQLLTNYAVQVNLTTANFDFTKAKADGSDLRVTEADGVTLMPYYVSAYDGSSSGTVWIKPVLIPNGSTNAYLYYGNPSPATFTLPPTGIFTRPTTAAAFGSAEDFILDGSTYYVTVTSNYTGVLLYNSTSPAGPWSGPTQLIGLGTGGDWDTFSVGSPNLFKSGSTWYLYYEASTNSTDWNKLGYATASSITGPYTKSASNPVLTFGSVGAWDYHRVAEPYVFQAGTTWYLFYMGCADAPPTYNEQVGYATGSSPAGPWTKYAGNPVLTLSGAVSADQYTIADPYVFGPLHGYYYLGYSGSVTRHSPWIHCMTQTKDFTNFYRIGNIYSSGVGGEWDFTDAHKGSVTYLNGTNYLAVQGVDPAPYKWGLATMPATSTAKGFDPNQVFDYYDDFSGSSLDPNKWGVSTTIANLGGTQYVSGGVLSLDSGANTVRQLNGRRLFGRGKMVEALVQHMNVAANDNQAGEVGLGAQDVLVQTARILDFNNAKFQKSTATINSMAQNATTNWVVHRVYMQTDSKVLFQNDNNAWENITSGVMTNAESAFITSYAKAGSGATNRINVDYLIVREFITNEPTVSVSSPPRTR